MKVSFLARDRERTIPNIPNIYQNDRDEKLNQKKLSHSNASNTSCKIIKQSSVRSNKTHKHIKILKNFGLREPMFNSIRFGKREKF